MFLYQKRWQSKKDRKIGLFCCLSGGTVVDFESVMRRKGAVTVSSPATSYRIDRRKPDNAYETIATISDTIYTDVGLETNQKYWYRVYALVGSNKSSEKNSVSGTTYTLTSPPLQFSC